MTKPTFWSRFFSAPKSSVSNAVVEKLMPRETSEMVANNKLYGETPILSDDYYEKNSIVVQNYLGIASLCCALSVYSFTTDMKMLIDDRMALTMAVPIFILLSPISWHQKKYFHMFVVAGCALASIPGEGNETYGNIVASSLSFLAFFAVYFSDPRNTTKFQTEMNVRRSKIKQIIQNKEGVTEENAESLLKDDIANAFPIITR